MTKTYKIGKYEASLKEMQEVFCGDPKGIRWRGQLYQTTCIGCGAKVYCIDRRHKFCATKCCSVYRKPYRDKKQAKEQSKEQSKDQSKE